MQTEIILGILRHVLTTSGGILVARGYTDNATVEAVAGAVITIAGAVWSIYHKVQSEKTK